MIGPAAALVAAASAVPAPAQGDVALDRPAVQGGIVRGRAPVGTAALSLDGRSIALASDGAFVIGFDRDHAPSALLVARMGDGRVMTRRLAVAPRAWAIERIDVARRPAGPSADYLARRAVETARIAAARARATPADGWRQAFARPAGGRISGRFGAQRIYRGEPAAYHSGTDFAAGAGAPVRAPADGVVVLAGPPALSLEGNLVVIDHGGGLNSAFLHLATQAVREGDAVAQGQVIGTVGATGRATGPHLHWSVKWGEARLDPELLLDGR